MRLGCWVFEAGPGVLWLDFGVLSGGHGFQAVAWGSGCGLAFGGSGLGLGLLLGCWGGCWGFEVVSGDMVVYKLSIQGSIVCFAWRRNQDEGLGMFCSLHLGVEGSRYYMGNFRDDADFLGRALPFEFQVGQLL